jgi:general secretion pathway protein D
VKAFFYAFGCEFPEGATAAFASEDRIIVKAKEEDLDLIAAWLAQPATSELGSEETKNSPSPAPEANADAAASIQRKLSTIIIPRLEFREASVREAADFLHRKSVELDSAEPDPAKRGISIVLKAAGPLAAAPVAQPVPAIPGLDVIPGPPPAAAVDPFGARITLSLANIPLGEACRYVASVAKLQYKVEPHAVVLTLAPNPAQFITKEYKVTPAVTEMISRAKGAKEFLTGNAVSFPDGASVRYFQDTQRLIMRNTPENHDRVADLIRETIARESRERRAK